MKKLTATVFAVAALCLPALAGPQAVTMGKETKAPVIPEASCFSDHEFQLDIFGQYSVGEGPTQVGLFRDHGWGGGIGLNYFFSRNIGIGVDAAWLDAKESPFSGDGFNVDNDTTTIHQFSGSLIFRAPMDSACLAPYVYVGGGMAVDGEQWATAHAGVGVEYRIVPQKVGIFLDGRWTYLGDRFGQDDLNYFSTRLGVRFVF
jgi:hypothetical protein